MGSSQSISPRTIMLIMFTSVATAVGTIPFVGPLFMAIVIGCVFGRIGPYWIGLITVTISTWLTAAMVGELVGVRGSLATVIGFGLVYSVIFFAFAIFWKNSSRKDPTLWD